ncbi:26S proteasome regulatory subunit 7 [Camellia lanceoleosa]|uniref:26S proteasome regulatory subunit 7 n=1 Tax=Camellia lanceoleosa TaxID=1840588 RepID=A0ACC0IJT7_9ERIC|nr:26S proteasome regulatory subunit 7 [Camellia lanceoleosa]
MLENCINTAHNKQRPQSNPHHYEAKNSQYQKTNSQYEFETQPFVLQFSKEFQVKEVEYEIYREGLPHANQSISGRHGGEIEPSRSELGSTREKPIERFESLRSKPAKQTLNPLREIESFRDLERKEGLQTKREREREREPNLLLPALGSRDIDGDDIVSGEEKRVTQQQQPCHLLQRNDPEKFVNLGIDPPKGVLCYGPPVANRTDACFIRVIGSELVKKYVGEGAHLVRELFQMARSKKACIVFFDELDAIGGACFDDGVGGDNEVQCTMLEIVNQFDGFDF